MRPEKNSKKLFKVLSCVIYTIISNYVCIDYLSSEGEKLSGYVLVPVEVKNISTKVMTKYWDLEFQIC